MISHRLITGVLCASLLAGCTGMTSLRMGKVTPLPAANPLYVATNNEDYLWERMVETLEDFQFPIAKEDRQQREISTEYKVGANVFEFWHADAVGFANRLEGTFQSVRRRVVVTIMPSEQQAGYVVNVVAYKEFEDMPGVAANTAGGATFLESAPMDRDLNQLVGQSAPSGWLAAGRDLALERSIVGQLSYLLSRK